MGRAGTGCSREHGRNGEIDSAIAEKLSGARTTPVWGRNPGDRKERRKKSGRLRLPRPTTAVRGPVEETHPALHAHTTARTPAGQLRSASGWGAASQGRLAGMDIFRRSPHW